MASAGRGRAAVASALAALAVALAGCGGDEPSETAATTTTSTTDRPPPREPDGQRPALGDGRGGVGLVEIGSFEAPVFVTQPPGETEDLYVVEQGGRVIRVGGGERETFLDLSDEISSGGERGLLSLAFAPDFVRSGLLYVDYTDLAGDTRIVEYRAPDGHVDPASARPVLAIDQPFENHNGGLLQFGPDELLYVGTGDGGSAGDPERNGQSLETLLGKILRIDPRPDSGAPYAIPADNPFAREPGARGEIYSYGLRNPWRFSFDRLTGALSIGDVGQQTLEEVDLVRRGKGAGANFGWSAREGTAPFNDDQDAPGEVPPILVYPNDAERCSVTGGYAVRDERLPSLYGRYLYADFCAGELRSFPARPGRPARGDVALGVEIPSPSSFGEDTRGRLYVVSLAGPVYRLAAR